MGKYGMFDDSNYIDEEDEFDEIDDHDLHLFEVEDKDEDEYEDEEEYKDEEIWDYILESEYSGYDDE